MILTILTIILLVALMIGANALYVAGEFAAVSARKTRIMQKAEQGNRFARMMLPILEDAHQLDNYIAASQVGITISSIVLGIYGQQQIAPLISPWLAGLELPFLGEGMAAAGLTATLVLLFLTTLQVVLGELVPKSLAIQYPERTALATVLPMRWSADYILKPLIVILNGSGALVLKLLGVEYGGGHAHIHSPEEIEILVSESHRGGLLDADERQLLHNAFRIGELSAGEIMIPRTRMITASSEATVAEALELAANSAYTRIPIYEGNIDHIIGFVHLKDLFRLYHRDKQGTLRSILREVPYVPETTPAVEVWETLNEKRCYLAIVFDEFGGTAGMITQEDLIEELFGEVQDEFDQESELIAPAGDGRIVVRGDMLVAQLNALLDLSLPTDTANTVGGIVLNELGRAPQVGDEVEAGSTYLRVEAVAGRSVREVSLLLPPNATPLEEEATF